MKLNFVVTEVRRKAEHSTYARFVNEDPNGRTGFVPGQIASFDLEWLDSSFPIELGNRYTLTLTSGAADKAELHGFEHPDLSAGVRGESA